MLRREALQRLTLLLGGILSPAMQAALQGQVLNSGASLAATSAQQALLSELADTIIPATDTPGAKAAGVEKFILRVIRDCHKLSEQESFFAGLSKLDEDCKTRFGKTFVELNEQQRTEAVQLLSARDKGFFKWMKQLTVAGYFTSEIGATKALEYLPVPGKFIGEVPLKPGQKVWAL